MLIATFRFYIDKYTVMNFSLALYFGAILLMMIRLITKRTIPQRGNNYIILCICMFIPSLYKNAYLADSVYAVFIYYMFTVAFSAFLFLADPEEGNLEFVLKAFTVFAIITSIVTWISFFSPNFYISNFIPLLPESSQAEALRNFVRFSNRMGLSTHYSRNAFYILLGLIGQIYFYLKNKQRKQLLCIIFFSVTLLIVGKRGHTLFFLAALIVTYFIFYRVKAKTILKFCGIGIVALILLFLCINFIPGTDFIFTRIFETNTAGTSTMDIRFGMYTDLIKQYINNDLFALGWGHYARSTGYSSPGVHNDYIQLICETGIIGFVLVVGSNIIVLRNAIKYCRAQSDVLGFIALLYNVFFLMYAMTGIPHYDVEVYMFYFLINAFLYNKIRSTKKG